MSDRLVSRASHRSGPNATPNQHPLDLVEESVAVFGLDMRVSAWNAGAERLYGWQRVEVVGRVIQAAVRCSPSEGLESILRAVKRAGIWRGEFVRTTKAGGTVIVKAKWSLRQDSDGEPLDIVETSSDVTDLRRTEESLIRVQSQYRNLFQASAASFWELDFSEVWKLAREIVKPGDINLREYLLGNPSYVRQMVRAARFVDANEQSISMFGNGDREELLRSLDPLWPDGSLPIFAESVVAAFEKREHYSAEAIFLSVSGQKFDTLFTVSLPPDVKGSASLLIGIVDITQSKAAKAAREKSERLYRDLFHLLPVPLMRVNSEDVVAILDEAHSLGVVDFSEYLKEHPDLLRRCLADIRIVEVNNRTVSMLRAQSAGEFIGPVARYWAESPEIFLEVMAARYTRKSGYEALIKMPAHDGTILDVLFFQTFASITGEEHFSVVQLIDVSDRIKAQENLARVQAEIAHAARVSVLGELTASIAHEVSQPLTAIEANTEASLLWLKQSPPDLDEVRELSARTAVEVQRAGDIIERIRSMATRAAPEQRSVELNPIIEEVMLSLRHELQRSRVSTSMNLLPNAPHVLGDRVQLQQVIVNLAVNAIQAMASANSQTRVLAINTSIGSDGNVLVEIADTGPGIEEAIFGRLFDSFFTTKAAGMGIGLSICRSIVEAHGGQISVENRVDRMGARFKIRLPSGPTSGPIA